MKKVDATKKKRVTRPIEPDAKRGHVQARVNTKEMQIILTQALVHSKGVVSDYVRLACLNYKPVKRKEVK